LLSKNICAFENLLNIELTGSLIMPQTSSNVPAGTVRRAVSKYLEGDNFPSVVIVEKHLVNVLVDSIIETIKMISSEAASSSDRGAFLSSRDIISAAKRLGFFSYAKLVSSRMQKETDESEKASASDKTSRLVRRNSAISRSRKKRKFFSRARSEEEMSRLLAEQDDLLSKAQKKSLSIE
jgi:predicted transcriptional regulator